MHFDPERKPIDRPCIPVDVLKEWVNGKLITALAEQMTVDAIKPITGVDRFRKGLDTAAHEAKLVTLLDLDRFVSKWPDTNIDK